MDRQSGTLLACSFAAAAASYWLIVWPHARTELRRWRSRAQSIPSAALRDDALATLREKWTNVEGAAAFAVLTPIRRRADATHALIRWQEIYDFADTLSEHGDHPQADSHQLHQALTHALSAPTPPADYYSQHPCDQDHGYLLALTAAARGVCLSLPSHSSTAATAIGGAQRITSYQTLHHIREQGHRRLAEWAEASSPALIDAGLMWWEISAAAASSLPTLAMIAAAADRHVDAERAAALHAAYWPWTGALHTLLDSLIDMPEDAAGNQPSLLDHATVSEIAGRMSTLANHALTRIERLPGARQHRILFTGMACLYLSAPEAHLPAAEQVTTSVLGAIGLIAKPAITILGLRRGQAPPTRLKRTIRVCRLADESAKRK